MAEQTTLARPYAKAVFELTKDAKTRNTWSKRLKALGTVAADNQVAALVGNPRVSREQLIGLFLEAVGEDTLGQEGKNLVQLLADNGRLGLLPEIAALYEHLRAEAEGVVDVDVTSADKLTKEQQDQIAGALKKRLGRKVRLHCRTDESLIGGALIQAGDLTIDGSVRGKLARLSSAMAH
ncbi:F-type H+-transporting ATPase subunit delta [Alkalispirillum mobile]|uniref:ATP synthase subunit delta n=1 Tax=Alkalispirillum mobile TaxID=85925 RepID=A0A498C019_9GAMM|nr:F0F1 ATP synthase subunit delta [Alkalispirillum mobile]RLK46500.1 F-type H+-transporting ATPase subunit delta [Alkalispirillum mobile]